jgi:DNA-binding CsgD family transcriptional regulator
MLRGRAAEIDRLEDLIAAAREGRSATVVVRGEAGLGKTALLGHVASTAVGGLVLHTEGVEAEMELPFAALQQLCAPLLAGLEGLPPPQRDALESAFGLTAGSRPAQFLVGLAVLTLLSDAAAGRLVVCLVDDAQWIDRESTQVLSFVAHRIEAEGVLIVFAVRDSADLGHLDGLPDLRLRHLSYEDARAVLESTDLGVLDEAVRDRIIAEARGNPLALLELSRALDRASLAGGFAVSDVPLEGRIEASFRLRVEELPEDTQRLLLLAAAEPSGDPALLWRAGAALGLTADAAASAETERLIAVHGRVAFHHPLLRSAIYGSAPAGRRRAVHAALADATDPELDPDRRAWHRAHSALAPDEDVASELERSAERARARGGAAAAAAFLERAAELTPDPRLRAGRTLAAAERKRLAGLPAAAMELLATAERGPLDEREAALALRLHGLLDAEDTRRKAGAVDELVEAARRLESLDVRLAREAYLDVIFTATRRGRLGGGVLAPARAARAAPRSPERPDTTDLLVDGLAVFFTDGYAAGTPLLKQALAAAREDRGREERALRGIRIASRVAAELYDEDAWRTLVDRHVAVTRAEGILSALPLTLGYLAAIRIYEGDLEAAASVLDECDSIRRSTGRPVGEPMRLLLAAHRGDAAETARLGTSLERIANERGEGVTLTLCDYGRAVLQNALGEYGAGLDAARRAAEPDEFDLCSWTLPELVEAAVRAGQTEIAAEAFERLTERTQAAGTTLARGIEARSRALLAGDDTAEGAYLEAIAELDRTQMAMVRARAQLLYGEWLRRVNRRADAREPLGQAHELFVRIGADGFAGRAARELLATGATPRKRTDDARSQLTAQEAQIAALARDGRTNPEIGALLFLSPRTVEWHLRHVFGKLGIRSRRELRVAFADGVTP